MRVKKGLLRVSGIVILFLFIFLIQIGIKPVYFTDTLLRNNKENYDQITSFTERIDGEVQSLLLNSAFKEIAVFLYTSDYKRRYLLASNVKILNKISNVQTDSFFNQLFSRNSHDSCTIVQTTLLPNDSELFKVLSIKKRVADNLYYMACPIIKPGGEEGNKPILIGYVSAVVDKEPEEPFITLNELKYYTKVVEEYLNQLTF